VTVLGADMVAPIRRARQSRPRSSYQPSLCARGVRVYARRQCPPARATSERALGAPRRAGSSLSRRGRLDEAQAAAQDYFTASPAMVSTAEQCRIKPVILPTDSSGK